MTHDEMNNCTNEELSNFTHLELSIEKTMLLSDIIDNFRDDIPSCVIIKLNKLCKNCIQACENNNIEIPQEIKVLKNKPSLSFQDVLAVLGLIVGMVSSIIPLLTHQDAVINNTYVNNVTNYVINAEYIININYIIDELQQTYHLFQ